MKKKMSSFMGSVEAHSERQLYSFHFSLNIHSKYGSVGGIS